MPENGWKLNGKSISPQNLFSAMSRELIGEYTGGDAARIPGSGWLRTNIDTANSSAYHAAEYQRLQQVTDIYPYYKYMTRADDRVRDEHAALHGKVFFHSDPIWDSIWPPNGWNCRCYITPLTAEEVQAEGTYVPPVESAHQQELIKHVPPDFRRNPGIEEHIFTKWAQQKFKDMPKEKAEEIKKKVEEFTKSIGYNPDVNKNINLPKNIEEFVGEENLPTEIIDKFNREPEILFRPGNESFTTETGVIIFGINKNLTKLIKVNLSNHEHTHHLIFDNKVYYKGKITNEKLILVFDEAQTKFYELPSDIKDIFRKDNKYKTIKMLEIKYPNINPNDLTYQINSTADTIASLTNGKFGWGHKLSYWSEFKGNIRLMEFLAHSGELKYIENKIIDLYIPEIKKLQIKLINDILK